MHTQTLKNHSILNSAVSYVSEILAMYRRHKTVSALSALSDRQLADIGVERSAIQEFVLKNVS